MKNFLKILLSNSNDISHKRLISVISFIVIIVYSVVYAINPTYFNLNIFLTFAGMVIGQSVTSTLEKRIK